MKIWADHAPTNDEDLLVDRLLRIKTLTNKQLLKFRAVLAIGDYNIPLTPFTSVDFLEDNHAIQFKNSNLEVYQPLSLKEYYLIDDENFVVGVQDDQSQDLYLGDQFKVMWTLGNILIADKKLLGPEFYYDSHCVDVETTLARRLEIKHGPEKRLVK